MTYPTIPADKELDENAMDYYLTTLHALAGRKQGVPVRMSEVRTKVCECYPEKCDTFKNDGEVNKILAYLKGRKLVFEVTGLARDGPHPAIATTEAGADIAEKYFVRTARRKELERLDKISKKLDDR